jgi:formate hydrogenlyase transcriptional activator
MASQSISSGAKLDKNTRKEQTMATSCATTAFAVNPNACFQIEDAASAKFALGSREFRGNGLPRIVGNSAALRLVLNMAQVVAPTEATVLINGETGTGKELIAEAIHQCSDRSRGPLVKLNCAAIPFDLLESELFGHERGAFTGAITQKVGRFEMADKGTLFLDEVGDISLALQSKLLRVLQEREFERLGGTRTHQVDVRLVVATNRNLADMVKRNEFRSDLYYRLNVFPIMLPPLRERREDIPLLVAHFAKLFGRKMGKQIDLVPPETMSALSSYEWPGNIRELQNFIERSVILTVGTVLRPPLAELKNSPTTVPPEAITLEDAERDHISKTLHATRWVVAGPDGAAARLGIKRTTLYFRMRKLGISRPHRDPLRAQQNCADSGGNFHRVTH